jgi:Dpy-30 motif
VLDAISGAPISFKKFINKYVMKVESHKAILEPDYFIKLIETAENKRTEEIDKIESGGLDSDEEVQQKATAQFQEWDKLQRASNEEYLMRTILPVLYQGMKVVDLERPEAPLEYLSLYLLKHQD